MWMGYLEGVSRDVSGGLSRRSLEGVSGEVFLDISGGGLSRRYLKGISGGGFSGHLWRGSFKEVSEGGILRGMFFSFCLIPDFHLVCLQSKK